MLPSGKLSQMDLLSEVQKDGEWWCCIQAAKQEAEASGTLPAPKAAAPKKPRAAKVSAVKKPKVQHVHDHIQKLSSVQP